MILCKIALFIFFSFYIPSHIAGLFMVVNRRREVGETECHASDPLPNRTQTYMYRRRHAYVHFFEKYYILTVKTHNLFDLGARYSYIVIITVFSLSLSHRKRYSPRERVRTVGRAADVYGLKQLRQSCVL